MLFSQWYKCNSFEMPLFIGKCNDLIVICHIAYFKSIIFKINMFGRRTTEKDSLHNRPNKKGSEEKCHTNRGEYVRHTFQHKYGFIVQCGSIRWYFQCQCIQFGLLSSVKRLGFSLGFGLLEIETFSNKAILLSSKWKSFQTQAFAAKKSRKSYFQAHSFSACKMYITKKKKKKKTIFLFCLSICCYCVSANNWSLLFFNAHAEEHNKQIVIYLFVCWCSVNKMCSQVITLQPNKSMH